MIPICYECEKEMVEKNGNFYCNNEDCEEYENGYTIYEMYEKLEERFELYVERDKNQDAYMRKSLCDLWKKYDNTIERKTAFFIANFKCKVKEIFSKEYRCRLIFLLKLKLGIAKYKTGGCPNCGSQDYESSVWRTGEDEVSWSCNCNTCGYFTED